MFPTIGWRPLPEAHKTWLIVPFIVDVNVAKMMHTLHKLCMFMLGWCCMSFSNVAFQMCINHVICVKTFVDAAFNCPTSPGQCMQATKVSSSWSTHAKIDTCSPWLLSPTVDQCRMIDARMLQHISPNWCGQDITNVTWTRRSDHERICLIDPHNPRSTMNEQYAQATTDVSRQRSMSHGWCRFPLDTFLDQSTHSLTDVVYRCMTMM